MSVAPPSSPPVAVRPELHGLELRSRHLESEVHSHCVAARVELHRTVLCRKRKTLLVLAGCAVWLGALGWIDRVTGFELGLFAFYTAPVAAVAWNLGRGPGIMVAFIASVIWFVADRYAGDRYSHPFFAYWNTGMHFTTFIVNAVTFAKIKSVLDQRHALERDLANAREQLRQLAGTPTRCPQCQRPQVLEAPGVKGPESSAIVPAETSTVTAHR
jgi:cytochrome c-type biogenesis protein CcmH/NrfF